MLLFPAIDLYGGKAVRLLHGDYRQMTVYDDSPLNVAQKFEEVGATCLHVVDLEGAKEGSVPHLPLIADILKKTSLFIEVGGGIRSDITKGDISVNSLLSVHPFNNTIVVAEISGQALKDMMEMAMMSWPAEGGDRKSVV